jgi:hypothetical protein
MPQADDDRWLDGRTRHVRVYLTAEEHALVRQAAALADRSVSRFSIEAIVESARKRVGSQEPPASAEAPEPRKRSKAAGQGGKKRKGK